MLRSAMRNELALYDDTELGALIGDTVMERRTVAEWPLSWTQKVVFASGRAFAYKAMLPPLIEAEFYKAAGAARLLPAHQLLGNIGDCAGVLVEWIEAPSLGDQKLSETNLLAHAAEIVEQIGEIGSGLPAYLDVGTPEKWSVEATATLGKIRQLASDGRFSKSIASTMDEIEAWALSERVLDNVNAHSRLVHRDLKPEHVFLTDDGYRVIDWQLPAIAPGNIDLVWLLEESGIDSLRHVDPVTYGIAYFLHLRWAAVGQHDFFPATAVPFLEDWANDGINGIIRTVKAV
jgi:hypothetical protein